MTQSIFCTSFEKNPEFPEYCPGLRRGAPLYSQSVQPPMPANFADGLPMHSESAKVVQDLYKPTRAPVAESAQSAATEPTPAPLANFMRD
jgi:hypothetical protein